MFRLASLFVLLLIPFSLSAQSAPDEQCGDEMMNAPKGKIMKAAKEYDAFIKGLADKKDPVKEINAWIRKKGLFISHATAKSSNEVQGYPDRMEMAGIGGLDIGIFTKRIRVAEKSDISLDKMYEVAAPESKKAIHSWQVPSNQTYPAAVHGNELIFSYTLSQVCGPALEGQRKIWLAVKPDGSYRAVDVKHELPKSELLMPCPAIALFPQSGYASCSRVPDLKTKKFHIIVWQQPMT